MSGAEAGQARFRSERVRATGEHSATTFCHDRMRSYCCTVRVIVESIVPLASSQSTSTQ